DERRAFELINAERQRRGRAPLVWDNSLTRMARYHSDNMARQGFFNHVDREGLDLSGRAQVLGVRGWKALGENIAYNQGYPDPAAFAVERWMISDKHRENILNGEFTHAGLGIARGSDGRVFFTQVFMRR
ncbi:MAG: CAP domain-containing protein, partial [Acidobacteriota bacterium]|nr:CAP domain-containing protein [Acidobacteriota bacterium]